MSDLIERLMATGGKGQGGPIKREAATEIAALRTALATERERAEKAEKERDEARSIVIDTHWMAVRYADNRKSYAVGMCNDALKKAYDAGWLTYTRDNGKLDPQYARDGMFDREWVSALDSANSRAETAEASLAEARRLMKPFGAYSRITFAPVNIRSDRVEIGIYASDATAEVTVGDFRAIARFIKEHDDGR